MTLSTPALPVRSLFISDVHLGTRACQAGMLLEFLKRYEAEMIYLVGDIVDGWQLRRGWFWPQLHNDVTQKLLRQVRKGARLIYIPGNHDEFLRDYLGTSFGGIEIQDTYIHQMVGGKRFLVLHGDRFDVVIMNARWLAHLGDWAYETALRINVLVTYVRRKLGLPYWSLSAWAKGKVKTAVNFVGSFERCLANEARRKGVDGVICGHIHHAVIRNIEGIDYINTGDWVESCTAVIEHCNGRLELVRFNEMLKAEKERTRHLSAASTADVPC